MTSLPASSHVVDASQRRAAHREPPARPLRGDGPGRRTLLTAAASLVAACLAGCSSAEMRNEMQPAAPASRTRPAAGTPKAAYQRLMKGNRRWVANELQHPDRDPTRRELLATSQQPYAAVLSCIDSRVPPELVFDTGLGDLFVMRSGGTAVGPIITGSVEYGPMTSGTPLIVVLGHQRCGAVDAAYKVPAGRRAAAGQPPGDHGSSASGLRTDRTGERRRPRETMARAQVKLTANALRGNRDLAPLVSKGALAVVSAYYSLDTGQVEILNGAPA